MIAKIIRDAESAEAEYVLTEKDAQEDYVSFVKDTTTSIEADRASIAEKEEQLASAEGGKSETEEAQLANDAELSKLTELLAARHGECDYIIKYFDIRQQARKEE